MSLSKDQQNALENHIVAAVDGGAIQKGQNTRFMLAGAIKALQIAGHAVPAHWEMWMLGGKDIYTAILDSRAPAPAAKDAE